MHLWRVLCLFDWFATFMGSENWKIIQISRQKNFLAAFLKDGQILKERGSVKFKKKKKLYKLPGSRISFKQIFVVFPAFS